MKYYDFLGQEVFIGNGIFAVDDFIVRRATITNITDKGISCSYLNYGNVEYLSNLSASSIFKPNLSLEPSILHFDEVYKCKEKSLLVIQEKSLHIISKEAAKRVFNPSDKFYLLHYNICCAYKIQPEIDYIKQHKPHLLI